MTFDNADELYKILAIFPEVDLLLRITTDDSASLCRLSQKFGVGLEHTGELLALAKKLGLNVVGVAFHCGSGASNASAFVQAVRDSRLVFDQARKLGLKLHVLDCKSLEAKLSLVTSTDPTEFRRRRFCLRHI